MYTLKRVWVKDDNIIIFDLWDYKRDSGFEIHKNLPRFQKEEVKKIHDEMRKNIGDTNTIDVWTSIIEISTMEAPFKNYKPKQHK